MLLEPLRALSMLEQARGLWLLHGDEPLLTQLLLDRWRLHWRQGGIERQRLELSSPADWRQALAAADSLSLFASQTAVEAHGHARPDADLLDDLQRYAQTAQDSVLVVVMPALDKAAQKTKFYALFEKHATVVPLQLKSLSDRKQLLNQLATDLQILLDSGQWQLLLDHSQNNLLAAHQTLLRLAALQSQPEQPVAAELFAAALVEQSRYSPFDLAEAALQGQAERAVRILRFLQESGEAPSLVLWALNRDMKLLMQLMAQPDQAQHLGIWSSRLGLYQQALRRLKPAQLRQWPGLLLGTDAAIKGVQRERPWDALLRCTLALAGTPIFLESSS